MSIKLNDLSLAIEPPFIEHVTRFNSKTNRIVFNIFQLNLQSKNFILAELIPPKLII